MINDIHEFIESDNYQEALNIYKSVLSIDSQNIHAVKGIIIT